MGVEKSRIGYIDIYRGIGIILMLMGHIKFGAMGSFFDCVIHAFHMPMFFFISGFLYKKSNISFGEFLRKKTKSLLIPYFSFGLGYYFIVIIVKGFSWSPLIHLLFINNTGGLPIAGALWFLTALFFTELIWFEVEHLVKTEFLKIGIVVAVFIFGALFKTVTDVTLPYSLGPACVGVGLYYIGNKIKEYQYCKMINKMLNMNVLVAGVLSMFMLLLIHINGYVNMRLELYSIIPLFLINAIIPSLIIMSVSKLIYKSGGGGYINWLRYIGENGIVYVCMNQVIIMALNKCLKMSMFFNMSNMLVKIIVLVVSLVLLALVSKIINNTKLKVLIGKES